MGEEEACGNKKSNVASLGRKLKLHLLVYIIDNRWSRVCHIIVSILKFSK